MLNNIDQYQPLWDKWHVDELLGQGVFGKVYRVSYQEYGHTYLSAVKMISIPNEDQYSEAKSRIGDDARTLRSHFQEMVHSLVNEVNILYSLGGNSNILGYHDHKIIEHQDKLGWDILIRMEYAKPLSQYLAEKQMTMGEIIKLGIDLCTALEICARHGIIHRDIKDENIFISEDGIFKLGDFGIAMKLSQNNPTAAMRGTPHFMAPEVYRGDRYGASVDIYSLGIVMYKLLNHGRLPFMPAYPEPIHTDDSRELLEKRMRGDSFPKPDQADEALAKVIMKACAYHEKDRYASPEKLKQELESVLTSLPDLARNRLVTLLSISKASIEPTGQPTIRSRPDRDKNTAGEISPNGSR
jgi:eukaryotic-like serine/threonine-protein kinase